MKTTPSVFGLITLLFVLNAPCGEIASQFRSDPKDNAQIMNESRNYDQTSVNDTGITEIGMERTVAYGPSPVYTVIIKSDGSFRYKGEQHVERQGEHTGKVSKWQLNPLLQFIRDSDCFSMQDKYWTLVTDLPTVFTCVVMNGKKKIISNYANSGPTKLWAIEQLIDKLLLEAEWDKENSN